LFGSGTKQVREIYADLKDHFHELARILCIKSFAHRPFAVFNLVEIFAGNLVKLQQYCALQTNDRRQYTFSNVWHDKDSESGAIIQGLETIDWRALLCEAVHRVLSCWLRGRQNHFNHRDRLWLHTRASVTHMLKNLIILQDIIAIKHLLGSLLTEYV
ncbi:unnamed protein product, partial [Gongylonema pulchrum]|uniref:Spindle pole body component n=1 Tax=Gongylonema pulchrum TaxID=637853 RepID=A0A183EJU9_9BILA